MLGPLAEVRHHLHRRGTGADQADADTAQTGETAFGAAAGVVVIPAAGVEGVAAEVFDAGNTRQLRAIERPGRQTHPASPHPIAAIGGDDPSLGVLVPREALGSGLEADVAVEIELPRDRLTMGADLVAERVLLLRHVADLLEQRQVGIRLDVAGDAGVAIPVPGAAEVAGRIDDTDALDTRLAQPRSRQQPAEAAADDRNLHVVEQRRAGEARRDIRVVEVMGEPPFDLDVLLVPIGAQPPVALLAVSLAQRIGVEGDISPCGIG